MPADAHGSAEALQPGLAEQAHVWEMAGRPVAYDGAIFVPARLELRDVASEGFSLQKLSGRSLSDQVGLPVDAFCWESPEAAWVRARIGRLFGFSPLRAMPRDSEAVGERVLNAGMLCVGNCAATPFVVTCPPGSDGEAVLQFSATSPESAVAQAARGFWDLLLAAPGDLEVFSESVWWEDDYHPARGVLECGFDGEALFESAYESWNLEDELDESTSFPLPSACVPDDRECPECLGTGLELRFLCTDCPACQGTGETRP